MFICSQNIHSVETLDTNSYLISKPINSNQRKENIPIRIIKYPPTKKYKIKDKMILTKKEIEANLISYNIPIEMSKEIALLLLENNPKNLYDLRIAKCVATNTNQTAQKLISKKCVNASTSCSDFTESTSTEKWILNVENLSEEKDR